MYWQPDQNAGGQGQPETLNKRQPGMIFVKKAEGDRGQHRQAEHHQQQPQYPLYDSPVHLDEGNPNLEKTLEVLNLAAVGHEQDDVIIGFYHRVMVRDDDLIATDDGNNRRAFR